MYVYCVIYWLYWKFDRCLEGCGLYFCEYVDILLLCFELFWIEGVFLFGNVY